MPGCDLPDGMDEGGQTIHEGRFLSFRRTEAGWEYVTRRNAKGCVAILAVTDDQRVVLVEQYRPPVGRRVVELPAGLAGDIPLQEEEPLVVAAKRELKEETGYEAKHWTMLMEGTSSAGLTDEMNTVFLATGLVKVAEGGGVAGESIRIHLVHRSDVVKWCRDRQAEGMRVDFKIFADLHLAKSIEHRAD
ncbi:MAG TPA: NUDIX hydrolase, partial [Bacteroidia bacterium]|nr:NUDIX hydrolase [Bacteroidia bacterium]